MTPLQRHLLECLAEECAELQQEIMKALRFGLHDKYRGDKDTPFHRLTVEFNDVLAIVEVLKKYRVNISTSHEMQQAKFARLNKFLEYAGFEGVDMPTA